LINQSVICAYENVHNKHYNKVDNKQDRKDHKWRWHWCRVNSDDACFPPRRRNLLVGRPLPLEMCGSTISATRPVA